MSTERPRRIQRLRVTGWRLPEGAIFVGRPGRWGSPFWHVEKYHGREIAMTLYDDMARGFWDPDHLPAAWPDGYVNEVYEDRRRWLRRIGGHPTELARAELCGHDLVCWCSAGQLCHADKLLVLANEGTL